MHTAIFKMVTNKDLLYSTWNSAQCYVASYMGGESGGRMNTCMCMAESLLCSPFRTPTFLIGYTPAFLGRKVMTNPDSILKSRNITLTKKVHLVKAMVFPVVMYGCESWTVKKAEHQRIGAFELWCWRRLLRVPWTARRSNQSTLKEISPGCSMEGLMLKLKL